MRILYDHQTFVLQKFGGISRYFTQIISNFPENVSVDISVKYSDNVYLKELKKYEIENIYNPCDKFACNLKFKGKGLIFKLVRKLSPDKYANCETKNINLSIEKLKAKNYDLFHPTYYNDYFIEHIGNKPFVLTIHDMIHELYPELLNDMNLSIRKAALAKKASHIISVSENTKKDIIDILNIPEEKISVIYHASSLPAKKNILANLPEKYFLFIGERDGYKNFMFFVEAIAPILKEQNDIFVVCTGRKFNSKENKILKDLNIRDNFIYVFIEEDELSSVYNQAIAFVFPSYYEGFGIPILEAFESDCPLILSNTSCFPEIAKDCALYFNPKDMKQMRKCMENIIDNNTLRRSLTDKGKIRVKDFSWADSSNKTLEVYSRVLKNE
ncbi:MAG: glycosyltransferase family 4 protein [Dysgonamonadaceae bacterium]|jgi:glycosyltransferase involved in cell wall biosynthesis|nr:glycosyltransferase family 4 protein [Dysgonamonadaceae bacterium]